MRLCYLINQLAPGGAPTLVRDIIAELEDNTSVTVCFIEGDDSLVDDLRRNGAEVVDFGAAVKFDPRALFRMVRFFSRRDFDIIHAHLPYAQILGRVCARFGNAEAIVSTQHNVPANYHPVTRTLERFTRPLDDATVAVSEGVERAFRGGSHRYDGTLVDGWCTIYNGIDVEGFTSAVESADCPTKHAMIGDDDIVFLNVSRYVPAKAQDDLIDAMAVVAEELPGAHLFVVGWGPHEGQLRDRVRDRELSNNVTVTGRVPSVHEYYSMADVFVSSSHFEGMPIAHLEAMAAGLPVVATNIPGVDEVVLEGQTGILVPRRDHRVLAAAMLEMADAGYREGLGSAGRQRAVDEFSIKQTVASHRTLYKTLTG